ncbi:helix-turn-helix domain-containing protein [Phenylobacterium sp.]|uniref:helix-turn-helix domain-containing protein n=1 Tax=Phenylobacterium sp. TaxID=1871053 RepID=UPI00301B8643
MAYRSIPVSWAKRHAIGALERGVSLDHVFERALIAPRFGDDRDHISLLQLILLDAVLVLETADGAHGIMRHRHPPEIGPLGFRILFGSANLGDGLLAMAKLYEISSPSIRLHLSTEGDQAFLAIQAEDERGEHTLEAEIQLAYLYLGLTSFLGRPFPVSWVATKDSQHFNIGAPHYLMRGPVKPHNCTGFAFPKALLAWRPPDAEIDEFALRPLRCAISLIEPSPDQRSRSVSNQDLRVGNLAASHMMAPSTYRRMIASTGPGFRRFREQALLEATLDLLGTTSWGMEAIAANLGYSDAGSLRRFVKRATGRTPSELRHDLGMAVPPARLHARLREILTLIPK